MDPFVRRLVERLHDPTRPLSRNRHFHTFDTPEGRSAMRVSRRLKSLQRDILACHKEGSRACFYRRRGPDGQVRIELLMERIQGRRVSMLQNAEFELLGQLLGQLPGVHELLEEVLEPAA